MDMAHIINQMLILAAVMMVGFLINKLGILDHSGNQLLTKLVLNVALPANVFYAILGSGTSLSGRDTLIFFGLGVLVYILYFIIAFLSPKVLRTPKEDSGIYMFMIAFSNCGFMGYPVSEAIFGDEATVYVSLFNILFSIFVYSLGIGLLKGGFKQFDFRVLLSPVMISTVLALILNYTGVKMPEFVLGTTDTIGSFMTPVAMITTGSALAMIPIKEIFRGWRIYPTVIIKTVILPIFVWLVLKNIVTDHLILGVLVMLSGMPTASIATMMCIEYGGNEKLASRGVFLSTVISVITIPLLMYILPL